MSESGTRGGMSATKKALLDRMRRERGIAPEVGTAIGPRPDPTSVPLSFGQERFWVLARLEPGSSAYNIPFVLRAEGRLDEDALDRTFQALIARHEVLRTAFVERDGRPFAVVQPCTFQVRRRRCPPDRPEELDAIVAEEVGAPFDLGAAPLLRVSSITTGETSSVLVLTVHHIVADAWSVGILVREAIALYGAFASGGEIQLPVPRLTYADFAAWERSTLLPEVVAGHVAFWSAALADAPRGVELPRDEPPAAAVPKVRVLRFDLDATTSAALAELARRNEATPFMVLLAAWGATLAAFARQDQVVVGCPFSGRDRTEVREVVGYFLNTLPMRVDLRGKPSFQELVRRVRAFCLEAFEHQQLPLERLQAELRRSSEGPAQLFETIFAYHVDDKPRLRLGDVALTPSEPPSVAPRFELALSMQQHAGGIRGSLQVRPGTLEGGAADELVEAFLRVIHGGVAASDVPAADRVADVPVSRRSTARGEVVSWEGAGDVVAMVLEVARRAPRSTALAHEGGSLSYSALVDRARGFAGRLASSGVVPGDVVAIELDASFDLVVAILGALMTGAAYLPLDPTYPVARRAHMVADAGARVVVVRGARTAPYQPPTIDVAELAPAGGHDVVVSVDPDRPAYVIYTSGSTGKPKGVVVRHRGLANLVRSQIEGFSIEASSRVLQFAALGFDASVSEIFTSLAAGATLVLASRAMLTDDLGGVLRRERISVVTLPPSLLVALDPSTLPELRTVVSAGEMCLPEVPRRWRSPSRKVVNAYGPTEATVCATLGDAIVRGARVTAGTALPNVDVHVLDDERRPVPLGAVGEVWVGGVGVAGYIGLPALDAERFVPDPSSTRPGARMYRTGDLGRLREDLHLELLGRDDQQVKLRGFRIELGEIESRLAEMPAVSEAAVVVQRHGPSPRLVAFVVPRDGARPTPESLRAFLAQTLPAHMIPTAFEARTALPRTPAQKIDRASLEASSTGDVERARRAPTTAVEQAFAEVWAVLLGRSQVGIDDSFFDLGGDSILAIQAVSRLAAAGYRLSVRDLLAHQTIAELAPRAVSTAPVQAVPPVARPPLTPIQRSFFARHPDGLDHWNQSLWLDLRTGTPTQTAMDQLTRVLSRYDAFRAAFSKTPAGWSVELTERPRVVVECLRAADDEDTLASLAAARQVGLSIEHGPLVRASFVETERRTLVFLVAHHLIIDAVSWRVLLEAWAAECQAPGGAPPVDPVPFSAWAQAAHDHVSHAGGAHAAYWRAVTRAAAGVTPPLGEAPGLVSESVSISATADAHTTQIVLTDALRAFRTTTEEMILAAVTSAVTESFGVEGVVLTLERHGRLVVDDVDPSTSVGWFTTTFPLLVERAPLLDTVRSVKEQLRRVPRSGFDHDALRWLGAEGDRPEPFVSEVAFNYLGVLDRVAPAGAPFEPIRLRTGPNVASSSRRLHAIELTAAVTEDRLEVRCVFNGTSPAADRLARLPHLALERLRALCQACTTSGVGHPTPVDFPHVELDQAALDVVLRAAGTVDAPAGHDVIEDLLPLTETHRGMLYHALRASRDELVEQLTCRLEGELDVTAFRDAWQRVVARHPAMRTAFVSAGLDVQVVLRAAELPFEVTDARGMSADAQHASTVGRLDADAALGFDVSRAPLMRVALVRLDERLHWLLWTHHHLVLDGWSLPLVIRDVFALLRDGSRARLPEPARPHQLAAWRASRDLGAAEAHWKRTFAGVTAESFRTRLIGRTGGSGPITSVRALLDVDASRELVALARRAQVTMSTIVQAAWAMVLFARTAVDRVAFGITVSGRDATLPGIETTVGVFINTIPLLVDRPRTSSEDWLRASQAANIEMQEHTHVSPTELRRWLAISAGSPLFESLLVFENYPVDPAATEGAPLTVRDVEVVQRGGHPFTVFAGMVDGRLALRIARRPSDVTPEVAQEALEDLLAALRALGAGATAIPSRAASTVVLSQATPTPAREGIAPRTPLERDLVEAWTRVLPPQSFGVTDSFFDLEGATSLTAVELSVELQRMLGRPVAMAFIFENTTIERMARRIAGDGIDERVDWSHEATLPPNIRPVSVGAPPRVAPSPTVLLTGATGFLGAFLLRRLLDSSAERVICIVRGRDGADGRARVRSALTGFGLARPDDERRIEVVSGALDRPNLGLTPDLLDRLSREVDVILHNGAQVNFMLPYGALKPSNVGGTLDVLDLATRHRDKVVGYVSSLAVFSEDRFAQPITESTPTGPVHRLHNGYAQSKWVADELCREAASRGVRLSVFRCGGIAGDSTTGVFNETDLIVKTIRACAMIEAVPAMDVTIDMTPVDYVSSAIVWLTNHGGGGVHHLANPSPISATGLAAWGRQRGYRLDVVDLDEWRARLGAMIERTGDVGLREVAGTARVAAERRRRGSLGQPEFRCVATEEALRSTTIRCPPVVDVLDTYLAAFIARGQLTSPT